MLGYGDAQHILSALQGQVVPTGFQGGLNFTYHIGDSIPSNCYVEMKVIMRRNTTRIYNVIGDIPGSVEKDRYVLVGCHRDAWQFGEYQLFISYIIYDYLFAVLLLTFCDS